MGTHPIFESDFDCLTEKNVAFELAEKLKIGAGECNSHRYRK